MSLLFLILIIVASALLGLIVLIQNPKGGGLSGNIAGFSNQFMGVKQTTDVLEKGTWILAGVIVFLCLISSLLINSPSTDSNMIKNINTNTGTTVTPPQQAPAPNTAPLPSTTTPAAK
ncbi:MAG: preprotein translocase subunit SecG [Sphingobacteriales bacterium]|jgi:preprotein translocase subunit SecG